MDKCLKYNTVSQWLSDIRFLFIYFMYNVDQGQGKESIVDQAQASSKFFIAPIIFLAIAGNAQHILGPAFPQFMLSHRPVSL